ncbi:hypothetical protein H8356DRAFT_1082297 [Neocallimastix lanati (nom. inval.)]|nr:hypothetical protein H8356DRAFT_1082297 [Neocallimastix sp. JGI-2020a]
MRYLLDNKYINKINISDIHFMIVEHLILGQLYNNLVLQYATFSWYQMRQYIEFRRTQYINFEEQLKNGIRYLELSKKRSIYNDINAWYITMHRFRKKGLPSN